MLEKMTALGTESGTGAVTGAAPGPGTGTGPPFYTFDIAVTTHRTGDVLEPFKRAVQVAEDSAHNNADGSLSGLDSRVTPRLTLATALARYARYDEAVEAYRAAVATVALATANASGSSGGSSSGGGGLGLASSSSVGLELAGVYCDLGDALSASGRFDEARHEYAVVLGRNPRYVGMPVDSSE